MKEMSLLTWVAFVLVIVGGINWGLVGLFDMNVVYGIFGQPLARLIYIVVGVAAGYLCFVLYKERTRKI